MTGWPRAAWCEAWDGATTVSCGQPNPQNLSTTGLVGGIPLLPFFPLSSPKPLDPPLPPLLSKQFSFPLFLPLLCQSIHSHSHSPQLNTSPVASSGPSKIRKNVKKPCLCVHLVQVCPHHLHKAKNCHKGVIFAWLQKHLGGVSKVSHILIHIFFFLTHIFKAITHCFSFSSFKLQNKPWTSWQCTSLKCSLNWLTRWWCFITSHMSVPKLSMSSCKCTSCYTQARSRECEIM